MLKVEQLFIELGSDRFPIVYKYLIDLIAEIRKRSLIVDYLNIMNLSYDRTSMIDFSAFYALPIKKLRILLPLIENKVKDKWENKFLEHLVIYNNIEIPPESKALL